MELSRREVAQRVPDGYVQQHTLWTRRTFNERPDSTLWRGNHGMIMIMPEAAEKRLHTEFKKVYPERYGGLLQPSEKLTALALAHLRALDADLLGRRQRFESVARFLGGLAKSTIGAEEVAEAKVFAEHLAMQADFYHCVLNAKEERLLGL